MRQGQRYVVLVVALLLVLSACGSEPAKRPDPTKAGITALLHDFTAAVTKGDTDAAMALVYPTTDTKILEGMRGRLPELMAREGVTTEAIDRLAERGTFGRLNELWPELDGLWAKKLGADPERCFGLKSGRASAAAHWDGSRLTLIYVGDLDRE
ncbi:MAG: hypothetical protein R3F05_04640 [Planctomycetota bacterium]